MTTPSTAFPFSPSPQSPTFTGGLDSNPASPVPSDDRRRSKRASTRAPSEDAASRYPSPPPGTSSRPRPAAFDPSLVIPPFNPNKRRSGGGGSSSSSSGTTTRRNSVQQQQQFDERVASLMPSPPLPAQYQTTHAHAHAQRPVSTAAAIPAVPPIPLFHQQSQPPQGYPTPQPPQGPGGSVSSRSRQSVGYLPTSASSLAGQGPYPHLYNPHPMPRQKIYFGPYILLQTLGEGEFGKVKLGVHGERWGEDVAIKLIKRGNVDTAQRGEKVRREIEVLKAVRHPNIVRLYDVIETEKYIGIVLEYASGGELFDHILAHRYLKERDASRLFAQLISGVSYLHAKGVVHRDLKLENLLLDRNRNVIITDFGFANRFHDATVDLMATSCGSPCYAAPELVVQDGRYVGTAVDVWSCGVILYAMLAGYLPYDDDPANPEGDNINLLYKYILSTPLTFPDWITEEPRHLLLTMLVPDPALRCTIQDVTRHSWLRKYAAAFDKTVDELEYQAQEMEMAKRHALEVQRQWLVQQQQAQQLAAQGLAPNMTRSQTAASAMGGPPSAAARHRSAMVTSSTASAPIAQHGFEQYSMASQPPTPTVVEEPIVSPRSRTSSTASRPTVVGGRRSGAYVSSSPPTTQAQFIAAEADSFSFETRQPSTPPIPGPGPSSVAMAPSHSAPPQVPAPQEDHVMADGEQQQQQAPARARRSSTRVPPPAPSAGAGAAADAEWRKKAHRATVQVEYDGGASASSSSRRRVPAPREEAPVEGLAISTTEDERLAPSPVPSMAVSVSTTTETAPAEDVIMESVEQEDVTAKIEQPVEEAAASRSTPGDAVVESSAKESTEIPTRPVTPPLVPFPTPSTPPRPSAENVGNGTPRKRKSSSSPAPSLPAEPSLPPPPPLDVDATPKAKKTSTTSQVSPQKQLPPRPDSVASSVSRHRHAPSIDRFSIRSLLGGSTTSVDKTSATSERAKPSESTKDTPLDEVTNRRKSSRRQKALSLQPFRNSVSSKVPKQAKANLNAQVAASRTGDSSRNRSSTLAPGSMAPPPLPTAVSQPATPTTPAWARPASMRSQASTSTTQAKRLSTDLEANWQGASGGATPSGKAKAVMDWFRRKSTKGYPGGELAPIVTDFDRPASSATVEAPLSSSASIRDEPIPPVPAPVPAPAPAPAPAPIPAAVTAAPEAAEQAPSVVVTAATQSESQPSSRSASGAQSQFSQKTASTTATTVTNSGASTVQPTKPQEPAVPAFVPSKLRFHQGALDKNAVTYRSPNEVVVEIKNALWNMGVDMAMEGDYKIKCVRKSRKKALATNNTLRPTGSVQSTTSSIGPAPSGPVDRRSGLPSSPTMVLPQSPSMGFRSLFNRGSKHASHQSSPLGSPQLAGSPTFAASPALSTGDFDPLSSPMTTSVSQFSMLSLSTQPLPVYGGDKSADAGDEVRFVVEVTRVKNLDRLYCVDIKRMKGGPWSYKHVYDQLLEALELGPVV
ncbi:hypothetical protein JCM5296_002373 [Sporobolomyces johnsonii]